MSTAGWEYNLVSSEFAMYNECFFRKPYCQVCAEHIFRRFHLAENCILSSFGSNTTITAVTATGKSVSNDLTIPVVHSDGIVKTIGNGSSSGFTVVKHNEFF